MDKLVYTIMFGNIFTLSLGFNFLFFFKWKDAFKIKILKNSLYNKDYFIQVQYNFMSLNLDFKRKRNLYYSESYVSGT